MKVVVAPDKFAGTMSAAQAATAIAGGWGRVRPHDDLVLLPVADGGEGMLDVVAASVAGDVVHTRVTGPMGAPVDAAWLQLPDGRAIVEVAAACGLRHVAPGERDPLRASSAGVGELLIAAAQAGASQIIVGLGGSATVDGGAGMAAALGAGLLGSRGAAVGGAVRDLPRVARVTPIPAELPPILAAVDVDNPLLGPAGAAHVFGPQKGADAEGVRLLEAALRQWADVVERDLPGGPWREGAGAGAAGGLGFALAAFANATLTPGAAVVAGLIGLAASLRDADVVITGEGSLDAQTLGGKAPDHVRRVARETGARVLAVAGRAEPAAAELFDAVETLGPEGLVRPVALAEDAATRLAQRWHGAPPRGTPARP